MNTPRLALVLFFSCTLTCCERPPTVAPTLEEVPYEEESPTPAPAKPPPKLSSAAKINDVIAALDKLKAAPAQADPLPPPGFRLVQKIVCPAEFRISESILNQKNPGIDMEELVYTAAEAAAQKALDHHPTATDFIVSYRYVGYVRNSTDETLSISYEFLIYLYDHSDSPAYSHKHTA